ncbi:uncharacterized protein MELLADRAFT_71164 [Melampsora larici-populina 98AG31]|uniref:Uncharacterized protein n=1 Tax=Melampsora larici-populina (strain 98AG31 / pathotype 3-4-7) TaxID=747676 RepID=F4RCV5_MELLP|nr:uncharacterized protein MELLADRAFT_71164 [Melampsora larici-populina 98AG31]EGG09788.1 hypothetical protein MELLADRAFT_71164 [Melampsora larici-populina 98AG31]
MASIQQPAASDQVVNPRPAPIMAGTVSSLTANLPTTPTPSVIQSSSKPVPSNPTASQPITSDQLASDWKDSINPSLVAVHSPAPMNETMKVVPESIIVTPQVISNEVQPQPKLSSKPLSVMEEMELVIEQQRKTQTDSIPTNLITPKTIQQDSETIKPNANPIGPSMTSLQNHQNDESRVMGELSADSSSTTNTAGIHCGAIDPAIQGTLRNQSGHDK